MPSKNHSKSMSQTERGFWREVFAARATLLVWGEHRSETDAEAVTRCAEFADGAVQELRRRLTWRST